MVVEVIIDLAEAETPAGSEVVARLVRLADLWGHGEWRREWRVGEGWCSAPVPERTARAMLARRAA